MSGDFIPDKLAALGSLLKQEPLPPPPLPPSIPDGATFYDAAVLALAHHDSATKRFLEDCPQPDPVTVSISRRNAIQRSNAVQRYWAMAATTIVLQRWGVSASDMDRQPWVQRVRSLVLSSITVAAAKQKCQQWAERHDADFWTDLACAAVDPRIPVFSATPAFLRFCNGCRRCFYTDSARRETCNHCRRRAERNRKRAQRQTDLSERICLACNQPFTPRRSDARCCSSKCRARLSRQAP